MQAIHPSAHFVSPPEVARLRSLPVILPSVRQIDVYEPENIGLVISGPLHGHDFDYIRAAYEQKLRITDHPYLYLEFSDPNRVSPQEIWDDLTQELKLMSDLYRIAIVRSAATPVDTGVYAAPGVVIHQFRLADAETAKQWLA